MQQIDPSSLELQVRQAQLIAGALILGVLVFSGMAVSIVALQGIPAAANQNIISLIMVGFGGLNLLASGILPSLITSRVNVEQVGLAGIWRTQLIVSYALCEGACFANLVAYLIERQWWSLLMTGTIVLIMLAMFPTRNRLKQFIESETSFDQ